MGRKVCIYALMGLMLCGNAFAAQRSDVYIATDRFQSPSSVANDSACLAVDTDQWYYDVNCNGVKDVGENYLVTDVSGFLALNQTSPQTITGDTPKLDALKSKTILGTDADGKIIEGTHQSLSTLVPYTGATSAVDLGGATSLEIPNSTNPTTDTAGQIAWDSDDYAIEVFATQSRLIPSTKLFTATIYDPDSVQADQDAVPILAVESGWAPHGITLLNVGIKTDVSSTYSVNFEEWTSPADEAPSTIETVATSEDYQANAGGSITDPNIAAGSIIYVDLPDTDIGMLVVWGTFFVNPGD